MNMNARIESGKEYSLADLFYGNNKVVIPDLQRDYCWGKDAWIKKEKRFADLVSGFVKRLFNLYNETSGKGTQTLGLIYGFEQPQGHIQICDGQQRLTTLFLLLGYVNTRANYVFSDYLMSKEEREDDYEPRLQYAIRESTLYFLSDLTKEVFIEGSSPLEDVLKAYRHESSKIFPAWYFREYDLDASIQNMLAALNGINRVAYDKSFNEWEGFGKFLLHSLKFLYYDMGTRSRGEETYVVINTTGEPLSPAENIKPIVIGRIADDERKKKCSDEWEEREEWFWKNRGNHKTSDINSYSFLVWYWQIGLLQERAWKNKVPYELSPRELFLAPPRSSTSEDADVESASTDRWEQFRNPDTIHLYFKALQKLVDTVSQDDYLKKLFQSAAFGFYGHYSFDGTLADFFNKNEGGQAVWQLNMILPAMSYLVKYPNAKRMRDFVERLRKNYFDMRRVRNPSQEEGIIKSGSYVDWRHVIQIVELSEDEEALLTFETKGRDANFKKIPHVHLNEWFGNSERDNAELARLGIDVGEWTSHRVLMGDLTPLLYRCNDGEINIDKTTRRWTNLKLLSDSLEKGRIAAEDELDKTYLEVANWYRLYRVLFEIVKIEHQPYTPWNIIGCHYSSCFDCIASDFKYVSSPDFATLLDAEDVLSALKKKCFTLLSDEGCLELSDSITPSNLIKAFLFAKTLVNGDVAIDFWDEKAISADTSVKNNKINGNASISWGNIICKYGYKRGWLDTGHTNKHFLDVPILGDPKDMSLETIEGATSQIKHLIQEFSKSFAPAM